MSKNTKAALWMGGPWAVLFISIIGFNIISVTEVNVGGADAVTVTRFANVILGGVSILSILTIPVGLIVGIVIIAKGSPKS